jgi:hypothetical protein
MCSIYKSISDNNIYGNLFSPLLLELGDPDQRSLSNQSPRDIIQIISHRLLKLGGVFRSPVELSEAAFLTECIKVTTFDSNAVSLDILMYKKNWPSQYTEAVV